MSGLLHVGLIYADEWPALEVYPVHLEEIAVKSSHGKVTESFFVELAASRPTILAGLPVEFFARELADLDALDVEALQAFVCRFGIPCSPCFGSRQGLVDYRERISPSEAVKAAFQEGETSWAVGIARKLAASLTRKGKGETLSAVEKRLLREASDRYVDQRWWGTFDELSFWLEEAEAVSLSQWARSNRNPRKGEGGIVSVKEVQRTVMVLQEIVRIMSYLDGAADEASVMELIVSDFRSGVPSVSPFVRTIGKGVTAAEKLQGWLADANRYLSCCLWPLTESLVSMPSGPSGASAFRGGSLKRLFGLTEAIAIQFFYELDDGNPWQVCGYEGCDRRFKYQRQNGEPHYLTPRKRGGTGFCCKSHAVMENRRCNNLALEAAESQLASGASRAEAGDSMKGEFTDAQIERALLKVYGTNRT